MKSNLTHSRRIAVLLLQRFQEMKNFRVAVLSSSKRMKTLIKNCRTSRNCEKKLTKIIVE